MSVISQDYEVVSGSTWNPIIRWATGVLTTVPITAISQTAPAKVTAPNHGCPNGWRVGVTGVTGMPEINAKNYPPRGDDWYRALVYDVNNVGLQDESSALYQPYCSGGYLVYLTPAALTGMTFSLAIYADPPGWDGQVVGGQGGSANNPTGSCPAPTPPTPLVTLSSTGTSPAITVDTTNMLILPVLQTAGLTWNTGYYVLQGTSASGVVTTILTGVLSIN